MNNDMSLYTEVLFYVENGLDDWLQAKINSGNYNLIEVRDLLEKHDKIMAYVKENLK